MSECDNCSHEDCTSCNNKPEPSEQDLNIEKFLSQVKNKLVIMSGKGGVGKSTVAADIAVLLSKKGFKVGLLDVDLHGPSIAGILGLTGIPINTVGNKMLPYQYKDNLEVMTVQGLLADNDAALIWRGPIKIGVIRQFLADTKWSPLDYLIIDCPPGTGDEPLTVVQTIPDAKAIVVTTPQEIALADVRKSLNFCELAKIPVAGIIENMSGFVCPNCHTVHNIFKSGGGEKLAAEKHISFLGKIPIDPQIVESDDNGDPLDKLSKETNMALENIVKNLLNN
ncbi:MAG: Mrp/NBP35 family ATP-binding protein [Acidaminococcaceae bacterium]|nr:Mrp/NBP35 family ATP-binding protein [Acidaminococcaceae bacterium]